MTTEHASIRTTTSEGIATARASAFPTDAPGAEWWRTAVIYQIYPRSFADSNGDGVGDLPGITSRLSSLGALGVDAIWLSPFMTSPQRDAGYDVADYCDVDPIFGTLADFDDMLGEAHRLGIRVIVDLVPNHSSSDHPWFQAALAAGPGSPARDRYVFRDGTGPHGELPPNNWESNFGGPAWTRLTNEDGSGGQWYLHIFDTSQPDFNWDSEEVRENFRSVLRFWLDRGVDGFRVDVAHGLVKADGLPDWTAPAADEDASDWPVAPYKAQDGVHEIYRDWHRLLSTYPGNRVLCAEAWVEPLTTLALWVRPDEMQQAFNFSYLETPWDGEALRSTIDDSIAAFGSVGAPSTWVLSNHDVVRHASRLGLAGIAHGDGIGPRSAVLPVPEIGLRRARAATALMLALPGSAYIYQGEELGLPEAIDLPDESRQDPTFFRTEGARYGRDGCRVPLPWTMNGPAYGFNDTGASWLPQPSDWAPYARESQDGVAGSTLELYRDALVLRGELRLGDGTLEWEPGYPEGVVAFRTQGLLVIANTSQAGVELPDGTVVLRSGELVEHDGALEELPSDTTVWMRAR